MQQSYMPFGLGSRACIGKNISLLEMNKLLPVILRHFDLDFLGNESGEMDLSNRFFVKPTNLKARVVVRRKPT
jgi:cytochrome P450